MTKTADRSTSQGGVLSTNTILLLLSNTGRRIVAYADDLVLLASGD